MAHICVRLANLGYKHCTDSMQNRLYWVTTLLDRGYLWQKNCSHRLQTPSDPLTADAIVVSNTLFMPLVLKATRAQSGLDETRPAWLALKFFGYVLL